MSDIIPVEGGHLRTRAAAGGGRPLSSKLGVAVVHDLVAAIVTGEVQPGSPLPPEVVLSQNFGVSRTVIRESIKRIEEKGLVRIEQGRGTHVRPASSWNVLDPVVLSVMVENDESLRVLDDLSVVRASLEASMAGLTASLRSEDQLQALAQQLANMEASLDDEEAFGEADAEFHLLVMAASRNTLADSITRILFERARESGRFRGTATRELLEVTVDEHRSVYEAIARADPAAAQELMRVHIHGSWARRRPS
ncbi:FadR family transcriptional regulator [Pseudoclavibacter sp. RFBJ3]|uniref:FadR/GntR family transcriptional regulator n=1 Tax=unclassified Pseudoclavibacter TaxID=2615177 RepID=UPI000CE81CF8|nr:MULTISPECIES: FCD domain-containing protein [unclassified Pseudoclavibacter]PPF87490.1 FadR family transcriptional regulator [Pseudoclavibacter sp. RFBJ5]PPF90340.1 FadR family transcriptional regulator [Pseudoclavibacter sp. RFBJ3]PPG01025.1 FadR family transcriptional regulator [Pseudoclavibacter sp. RFBH5]PPG17637.1 FadR family transcriptional regulator [Pseudoclavibacter sp. RFBI4]